MYGSSIDGADTKRSNSVLVTTVCWLIQGKYFKQMLGMGGTISSRNTFLYLVILLM